MEWVILGKGHGSFCQNPKQEHSTLQPFVSLPSVLHKTNTSHFCCSDCCEVILSKEIEQVATSGADCYWNLRLGVQDWRYQGN